ncbi:MAG: diguanylate cyclase (GGDEF)-like protein/PAS domain S-box-containing protein [Motiliproteus sp.]|jgi:diguanylate cyclase (GGDEF)-like protein/PAS domain S-box-containing protein
MAGKLLMQAKLLLVPLLVLTISLLITYALFYFTQVSANKNNQDYLDFRAREAVQIIKNRMADYETILRGAGGLFQASENVTREEFKRYISSLRLADNYPGIQGVGFSVFIPSKEKDNHIRTIRAEGFPSYSLYPEGEREAYSSIIYLEPFSGRNLRAFGYDMFSESIRHAAMQKAVDNDSISVSGKVRLVQESGNDEQAGFLMYYPIYKNDKPHTLISERRENLIGWVYSVFRMNDFMRGLYGEHAGDLAVVIFDGDVMSYETFMFDSEGSSPLGALLKYESAKTEVITVVDHAWTVSIRPLPMLELRTNNNRPFLVAVIGVFSSLILTLIFYLRERNFIAEKQTNITLANQKLRLSSIIEGTHAGTWEWDIQSGKTVYNDYWAQIIGYTASELKPTSVDTWIKYTHPDDVNRSNEFLEKHLSGELSYYESEVRMRHKNGGWVWVLDRGKVASWTAEGKPLLMFGTHQDISNQKMSEIKLLHKSEHDPLTDLPNRVLLSDRLHQALLIALRDNKNLAVIFIDLDEFKIINDTLGHDVGDLVLIEVAKRIKGCLRESDTVARFGGDEFVVLLPAVEAKQYVYAVAEKIRNVLTLTFEVAGHRLNISSSIGVAIYPEHGDKEDLLLKNADTAMYAAKNGGRNNVHVYNDNIKSNADLV